MLAQNLVHVGYGLMLLALLAQDVLWLRALLALAQLNLSLYSYFRGIDSIAAWNAVFVAINLLWVLHILRQRRAVRLPEALAQIHARHFAALQPPEFLRLWRMAERRPLPAGTVLTRQGQQAPALYFLLQGAVRVRQGGREVAHLGPGEFVAEMSLLTGALASADAESVGEAEAMCWPVDRLRQLRQRNAGLWTKIQSVLGHDLVAKIQRAAAAGPVLAMPAEAL